MGAIRAKIKPLVGPVLDMSYHRNGVSGRGFWTILFEGHPDSEEKSIKQHAFVATFFPREEDEDGNTLEEACVSVLRLRDLNAKNAERSWRGDNFHAELAILVQDYVWTHDRPVPTDPEQTRRAAIKDQKALKKS